MESIPHSRPWIGPSEIDAVSSQLRSLQLGHGALNQTFAAELGRYVGVDSCVTANSGTQALIKAIGALHLNRGAKVLMPTYVCRQVKDAVLAAGCAPVIADVNDMGVLDPATVEMAASEGIRAVIAVHVLGHPCDIEGIGTIGLPVIEDACQALGLRIGDRMAGSIGTVGIFSMHATKCISSGEGGAVVTSDMDVANNLVATAQALNSPPWAGNLSDIGASLALSQLRRYQSFITRRKEIDIFYREAAMTLGLEVGGPAERDFLFRFTVRLQSGLEQTLERLWNAGICARRGVDTLLRGDRPTPQADALLATTLSLPFHPSLSDSEVERVADAMRLVQHA